MWNPVIYLAAFAAFPAVFGQEARIINGNLVDTLRRFPHHVTIKIGEDFCSGSIISDKWILTSLSCVDKGIEGKEYQIMFHRRYLWDNRDSFSVSVPESAVTRYPTGYDDIALIKLPIYLVFTDEIKPIKLGGKPFNDLVVMAGFNDYSSKDLTYGMFALASKNVCKRDYGSEFDEYLQLCTLGWRNNNQAPCAHDEGGGLVTGWPTQPRLIGVLSRSTSCKEAAPAVFTDVNKYLDWMISVTGNDLLIEWDN